MTSILATAVAPVRSRLRDLLERPGTQHTIMALILVMVPSMRRVVGALLAAIPGLGAIALVLLVL